MAFSLPTRRDILCGIAAAPVLPPLSIGHTATLTRGGTFIFGASRDVIFFDPVYQQQTEGIWFGLNVYDTLLQPTADGKALQSALASEYVLSPDGLKMKLTLRPRIEFSDGSPILAADVKFTLDRGRSKDQGGNYYFFWPPLTLLKPARMTQWRSTSNTPIRSSRRCLRVSTPPSSRRSKCLRCPASRCATRNARSRSTPSVPGRSYYHSGSMAVDSTLIRNPYYWKQGADGKPLPYLDKVQVDIIPDDATRFLMLKAGEINGTEFVPFSRAAELKADPKIHMVLFPAEKIVYLGMNIRPTLKDGRENPLADKRVRQALNYAVDKKAIAQIVTYGMGVPQVTLPPASTPLAMTDKGEPYPYNPAKAKSLLEQAGYDHGLDLTIYAVAGNADDAAELAVIQQMWGQLGIRLKVQLLDSTISVAKYRASDFQMRAAVWTNDYNDPSQIVSYMAYYPAYESDRSGFNDAELNTLFERSRVETDAAQRKALFRRIQEIYIEAAPMVFLLDEPYPVALDTRTEGFVQLPLGNYLFSGIHMEAAGAQ